MPKVTLDQHFVNTVTCPEGKTKENYYDTAITGLIVEVRATGGKTYALRYRKGSRQYQYKIGNAEDISFSKARNEAMKIRSKVVLGEDPSQEKRNNKRIIVPTFSEFCRDRYMPFVKSYKRSHDSDDSYLRNHLLPRYGNLPINTLTEETVLEFKQAMRNQGFAKGTINRGLALLSYIFNLAIRWKVPGLRVNPAAAVKLYQLNNNRERYLTPEETKRLYVELEKSGNQQLKSIVGLLLLLGCRRRELLNSRWEEFDLERRTWRIPLPKSGKARHVPLSTAALEILHKLPRWDGCPYVVPNPKTHKPYVSIHFSWNKARNAAGLQGLRLHDLRHSMASFMVNSGRSLYEIGAVLGHASLKSTQRYSHLSNERLLEAVDVAADATGVNWAG